MKKTIIIGAGPAGTAAGCRLSERGVDTLVLERGPEPGGLSRTVSFAGFRADVGGHRFYTKNEEVLDWWRSLAGDGLLNVPRRSRVFYDGRFFAYPLSIGNVVSTIGAARAFSMVLSYLRSRLFPPREISTFEQWTVGRFGARLYRSFFQEYTEKVWGLPCSAISSDMAGQRIKGLSLSSALLAAMRSPEKGSQLRTLVTEFFYPKNGAGTIYDAACGRIVASGGRVRFNSEVTGIRRDGARIAAVVCEDRSTGKAFEEEADDFCSSMPLTSLARMLEPEADVLESCSRLRYRSLIMVYCAVRRGDVSPDNWIYVNSGRFRVARIQNIGNWSKELIDDPRSSVLGMEYFCDEGDPVWEKSDGELGELAAAELESLGLCGRGEIAGTYVQRAPGAYPVYARGYEKPLKRLRAFVGRFPNLHCIGRGGMFHYNSMDHSVLTGFRAADNVLGAGHDLWSVEPEGGRYA